MAEAEKQVKEPSKLSLKMSIFLLIACPLIVIVLCSITISITAKKMVPDNMYSFDEPVKYEIAAPQSPEKAIALADSLAKNVEKSKTVKVDSRENFRITGIDGSLTDGQKGFVSFMAESVGNAITDKLLSQGKRDCEYGNSPTKLFERNLLSQAELFTSEDEKAPQINSDNGELKYKLILSNENADRLFIDEEAKILGDIKTAFGEYFTVESGEMFITEEKGCYAQIKADALKGELREIYIYKPLTISLKVSFIGSLASLGKQELVLKCEISNTVYVSYAGLTVKNKEIIIHKSGYDTLNLGLNVAENADAKVTFVSSDPSVCTVDEKGMVEAVAESEKPVTVTATLEYLGEKFTDTCTVWVITKATGVDISHGEHEMKVNETFELSAKVEPKDATVKDIMWLSSDEKICTVDEKGIVTAHASGEVLITAVTVQGHFMEACKINVKG